MNKKELHDCFDELYDCVFDLLRCKVGKHDAEKNTSYLLYTLLNLDIDHKEFMDFASNPNSHKTPMDVNGGLDSKTSRKILKIMIKHRIKSGESEGEAVAKSFYLMKMFGKKTRNQHEFEDFMDSFGYSETNELTSVMEKIMPSSIFGDWKPYKDMFIKPKYITKSFNY